MRQAKPERGGCRRLKLLAEPSRRETCPAQASDQPVSSVAWNEGDLGCEAYTESVQAMVVQPRNHCSVVRADTVPFGRRRHRRAEFARRRDLTGVRERGMHTRVPQEPGRSRRLQRKNRSGSRANLSRPRGAALRVSRSEEASARVVPPSEGNEARREGRREVGAPRSTREAREPKGTSWREGGAGSRNCWRERWRGNQAPRPSQRNCSG